MHQLPSVSIIYHSLASQVSSLRVIVSMLKAKERAVVSHTLFWGPYAGVNPDLT